MPISDGSELRQPPPVLGGHESTVRAALESTGTLNVVVRLLDGVRRLQKISTMWWTTCQAICETLGVDNIGIDAAADLHSDVAGAAASEHLPLPAVACRVDLSN